MGSRFGSALVFGAVVLLAQGALGATTRDLAEELLRDTSRSYLVEYEDGTRELVRIHYEGFHYRKQWQTGSSGGCKVKDGYKLQCKTDTRKCHWDTKAWVRRRAYFVSKSGINAPISDFEQVFYTSQYVDRGPDDFIESLTYHTTCGRQKKAYNRDVTKSKNGLTSEFDAIVKKDQDSALEFLKGLLQAVSLKELEESADD